MNPPPRPPAVPPGAPRPTLGPKMGPAPFWKRSADPVFNPPAGDEPFDALTDLFLGEVGGRGTGFQTATSAARGTPRGHDPSDTGPVLRLAGGDDPEDETSAAERQRAPLRKDAPVFPAAPVLVREDEDEGEARPIAHALPPPARNPVLECLVLANLPVLASAWASQYVREVADAAQRPVAYLRVQAEFVALELTGQMPEGVDAPRADQFKSLEEAIDAAAEITDRWIVRCDAGREAAVAALPISRLVTVLTGADQTARAGCRATFQSLAERLPKREKPETAPMVRLALMGAGADETSVAARELAATAELLLGHSVTAIACAGKIGGSRPAHTLFSGAADLALETILTSLERALVADPVGLPRAWTPPAEPAPAPTVVQQAAEDVAQEAESDFVQPAARSPEPERVQAPATVAPAPEPIPAVPAQAPAAQPTPTGLAAHLTELKPLPLRCPYAESVEIALDTTGALHLLMRSSGDKDDDAALAALLVASSWTEAHAALLAAGLTGLAAYKRPTLHLFTDRPKRSRRLLETNLRVHLLAQVSVGSEAAWFCTDLN